MNDLCNIRVDRSNSLQLAFFISEINHGRFLIYLTGSSYYAQVADDAMMGDRDAMDEMYGEFGEGEW